ncbi:MAG TPA: penicillin-binding transpeptidase domain-containing protein, partial [Ktedonobacteraceae bacterium]|nr:penicillin-binding transpeptidase domain-containing protein [Ktedonobacteraceae bacterium]
GSTIKPIVYATAFQMGWYPGIRIIDGKTIFPKGNGQTYIPSDYQNSYHPDIWQDVRISLQNSFNIPAVKALMYAGIDNVVNTARRMGITAIDRDLAVNFPGNSLEQAFFPSLALGTAGIPPLQMVDAYQTFADNGIHIPYHNVLDIWDNFGHNLYHYDPAHPDASRVLSPQISFLINNMLTDNAARHYEFSGIDTLTMADWNGQEVGAKTGTTDDFKDNWTIGYTTNVVVGVWSGNANGDPMQNVIGVTGAGNIWHDIIEYASGRTMLGMHTDLNLPPGTFPTPSGVLQWPVNTANGLQGTGTMDWMIDGEQPQQTGLPDCTTTNNNGNNNAIDTTDRRGKGKGDPTTTGGDPLSCAPTNNNGNNNGGNGNDDIFGDSLYGGDPDAGW